MGPAKILESIKEAVRPYYLKWLYFPITGGGRPSYFRECWKYPDAAPGRPAGDEADLLFFPMTDWHTRIQRTQHLARTLAGLGHRCFYVNPHLGRQFHQPYPFSRKRRAKQLEPGVVEAHIHLPREPVFHHRALSGSETGQLVREIEALLDAHRSRRLLQIASLPLWLDAAKRLRERRGAALVYDCHDVLHGFRVIAPELIEAEDEMFRASDLVVFSSRHLLESNVTRLPWLAEKSVLVRNAVDESWLRDPEAALPPASGQVVVGYVGALDFWFDTEAIELAARRHPEWRFELVGRVEHEPIRRLERYPNVSFRGEIPHEHLHRHLARYRVALIPFLRTELTLGTNPIKLYEYFSHGLPVVSTRLPEMEDYSPLVYLADSAGHMVEQMARAAAEDDAVLRQQRIRTAHRETWPVRAEALREAFARLAPAPLAGPL